MRKTSGRLQGLALGLLPVLLATQTVWADEALPGARLSNACTSCHGVEGRSGGAIPSLAGQSEADLLARLKAFQAGTAEATIMNRLARGYTDDELAALAAYFSAVTP